MIYSKNSKLHVLEQTRKSSAAGRFYPLKPSELRNNINSLLNDAPNYIVNDFLQAIVVPHAGYIFSGEVAGSAYKALQKFDTPVNVFIIGSSHQAVFEGASIYFKGDYETPLGKVKVNKELCNNLFKGNKHIFYNAEAHHSEHTIEVQLPFLQHLYGENLNIIPIVIGTNNIKICESLAQTLKPYFKPDNLFVISSDFSHYPEYHDAVISDGLMAKSIIKNDITNFLQTRNLIRKKHFDNLVTPICGFSSIYTLLNITKDRPYAYKLFNYRNSGDHVYFGDKTKVVGYWSMGVVDKTDNIFFTNADKDALISMAHQSIESLFLDSTSEPKDKISSTLRKKLGAFVSIYIKGELRGCKGRFAANTQLHTVVKNMAKEACTTDSRFKKIQKNDLTDLSIEISVLKPLDIVHDVREIKLGKHGIHINYKNKTGTYLPQVATRNNWTVEEFLGNCTKVKAGLDWDDWKNAEIFKFEAIVVKE